MKRILLGILALGLLAGCSSEPPKTAEPAQPAKPAKPADEYQTGRIAFQKLYVTARAWAADAEPFRLESQYLPGAPSAEGKAGMWRAFFASAQRRAAKSYLWSGTASEEQAIERGISPGLEDTFNPSNPSTHTFDLAFLKVDSDQAFQVAQEHGGEALLKKTPNQPVLFILDWDSRKNQLVWHVVYGEKRADAKLTVAVDASTGAFLKVEK